MVCAYGASVKPGLDPNTQILVDRSLWEAVTGVPSSWIDPLLDVFTFETIKASDLCALNVADPLTPDLATLLSLAWKDPFSIATVGAWVRDKLHYIAFTNACVCNAAPSVCNTQQEAAGGWTDGACLTGLESEGFRFTAIGNSCEGGWLYTGSGHAGGWPAQDVSLWDVTSGLKVAGPLLVPTPGDINTVHAFSWALPVTLVPGQDYVICIEKAAANCYAFKAIGVPSTATYTGVGGRYAGGAATLPGIVSGVMPGVEPKVCNAGSTSTPTAPIIPLQPTTVQVPPDWTCATACDIMTRLQQVSDRIEWLRRDVTLIQRQHVPFGYVAGAPVTLLAGHGTIAVQGILGALVTLTTVPLRWGQTDDTPRRLIPKVGALSFGDTSGVLDERQVHYDNQLMLGVPGAVTAIEWSFRPGVVATITPLYREP